MDSERYSLTEGRNSNSPQILVFSPRERIRNVLIIGLLQCHYRMIDTSNPYIAVMKIKQFLPDLVIIDITESNTKGFLIVNALKKADQTKNIPILLIVPSEPEGLLDKMKKEYADRELRDKIRDVIILEYPFNFTVLVEKIKEVFG